MQRVRITFCGITRPGDADHAARLGADAIGLVFSQESLRAVTLSQARAIAAVLPPFVSVIGVFMDPDRDEVEEVLDAVRIDMLQFHGDEPAAFCAMFGRPFIKAVPMGADADLAEAAHLYPHAAALLLDGNAPGEPGGRGKRFEWRKVVSTLPIILAGGLTPENVGAAIVKVGPYAVDVASGVESAPGIKDHERMAAFAAEVNRVGQYTIVS